ncbi:MAG: hypothetical protein NC314_10300 [Roseburia sp.]|nr:hypothetical protein [Ruminococcus sp.]MCM1155099.1 hypothetical protein [Roseburia sp.]MCM1243221.1 hypothetical protein [Roseburia sp.]
MNIFKKIFNRWRRDADEEDYDEVDWESEEEEAKESVDFDNKEVREAYVRNCLDKMAEATKELENLTFEYDMVTSYLKDMEEIEALPEEEAEELQTCAKKVELLQNSRDDYMGRKRRMSDDRFRQIERMLDEIEEGCEKIKEAEQYQELVKKDLSRLEGEKHAYLYRKNELTGAIADTRGMAIISVTALGLCFALLLFLQFFLEMDTKAGYLITAGVAAFAITLIYVKHSEARRDLRRVELSINKIILLQNKVKIRYVNNTNLLDYLYLKYNVTSAEELENAWNLYFQEKEEREKCRRAELDLDYNQQELLRILRRYQVKDPAVWLHQTEAILDHKEMVEIRHGLIIRRQSLRRRMDYNKEVVAGGAQKEIKELVHRYPKYTKEIIQTVEKYEKKM